ncbi:hypothetical protein Avbf_19188 [Armadillidium vulgare]|nr:hypothetical protein Avbf_19188 [Armadillidium vulgare]
MVIMMITAYVEALPRPDSTEVTVASRNTAAVSEESSQSTTAPISPEIPEIKSKQSYSNDAALPTPEWGDVFVTEQSVDKRSEVLSQDITDRVIFDTPEWYKEECKNLELVLKHNAKILEKNKKIF